MRENQTKGENTVKARREQIETAISDLIDNVERFFGVARLAFLDVDGGNDDIGCYLSQ